MNSLRPLLRLAWREVTGHKARTALVVGLVALMVGVAVGAGTIARTTMTSDEDYIASEFGAADAILHLEPSFFDQSAFNDVDVAVPVDEAFESERFLDPAERNAIIEAAEQTLDARSVLARSAWLGESLGTLGSGRPFSTSTSNSLNLAGLDLTEPIFDPRYELLEGRLPEANDEVVLTPRARDAQNRDVGDSLLIWDQEFTVVGEIARTGSSFSGVAIVTPEAFDALEVDPEIVSTELLFADTNVNPQLAGTGRLHAFQEEIAQRAQVSPDSFWLTFQAEEARFQFGFNGFVDAGRPEQLSTLVAALFAVQVAFVAAAAFAVGVARRTRQFGQLQATGASNPQLQRVVLIQAGLSGLLGAAIGVGVGFGLTLLAWSQGWLDTFGERFPIDLRWSLLDLIGPMIVGVGAALAAAWWPTRRLRNLAPASALAGHVPISRPHQRTPIIGVFVLAGGTLLLLAVTSASNLFGSGDLGTLLLVVAVLSMFGGALASIGLLIHKVGERADRFGLLARIVARNSARHQARSWVAVAALVAVVILPVVLGASTKAYPNSFANGTDATGWIQASVSSDRPVEEIGAFFDELDGRVQVELGAIEQFPVVAERQRFDGRGDYFVITTPINNGFQSGVPLEAVRGTAEILTASGLDPDLWSAPDAPEAVVLPGTRSRPNDFDGTLVHGTETLTFSVAEPAAFLSYDVWLLVPPEAEQRFDLMMEPQSLFLDVGAPSTLDDEVALANLANDVWTETVPSTTTQVNAFINADRGLSGPTATQTAWLAIGAFTLLAIVISLVTSSLAAVEVDKEISTMIAAGAPPSMRRRLLGAQTTYHLFIAAAIGVPLAVLIFWAATRADDFGPSGPTFPWISMVMTGLVVPVIVGLAVAVLFRNGHPSVSRRV